MKGYEQSHGTYTVALGERRARDSQKLTVFKMTRRIKGTRYGYPDQMLSSNYEGQSNIALSASMLFSLEKTSRSVASRDGVCQNGVQAIKRSAVKTEAMSKLVSGHHRIMEATHVGALVMMVL